MSDATETDFDELKMLVDEAFPDLKCLRCGNEAFLLADDVDAIGTGRAGTRSALEFHSAVAAQARKPVLTLACTRCGYLENHVVGLLRQARKPIVASSTDG